MSENFVICVKWGDKYSHDYVNTLYNMVNHNLTIPHTFFCMTDNSIGLDSKIETINFPKDNLKYFWNKLFLFDDLGISSTGVYFDLDVIVKENIDGLFTFQEGKDFIGLLDWNRPYTLNTSVFRYKTNKFNYILDDFYKGIEEGWLSERSETERDGSERITYLDSRAVSKWFIKSMKNQRWIKENTIDNKLRFGGDQEWTTVNALGKDLEQNIFPKEWILSYRKHRTKCLSEQCKAIIFHGHPKPHEANIKEIRALWK